MIKQTILITGGTGVLGNQFAKYFAKKGWQVLITSTQKDKAIKFKNSFLEGKNIEIFICDLVLGVIFTTEEITLGFAHC